MGDADGEDGDEASAGDGDSEESRETQEQKKVDKAFAELFDEDGNRRWIEKKEVDEILPVVNDIMPHLS